MTVISIKSITEVNEADWENLAPLNFPFASYSFLAALEATNCLGNRTGWYPLYQLVRENDELVAAYIVFLKTNSYGEYIFDFAWANAYESAGLNYFPKLVSAIPFTPATGAKLLFRAGIDESKKQTLANKLFSATLQLAEEIRASSVHSLFLPADQLDYFDQKAFTLRHSYQFHWANDAYPNFAAFLAKLKSKRRKEILRERSQVEKSGVTIHRLTGRQLTEKHAVIMHAFYENTVRKMGAFAYLTKDFYKSVFKTMSDQILLVLACDPAGQPVAGALNYFGSETLFGRSWGCIDDYKSLHFELCYYQGIEFAIDRGLKLFEAGAQGEHKLQRGFMPSLTYSAHGVSEPQFKRAIDSFIRAEKLEIGEIFETYKEHSPFSSGLN